MSTCPTQESVFPLSDLPTVMQERIAHLVAQPKPPERWLVARDEDGLKVMFALPSRAWFEWYWQRGLDPNRVREPIPAYLRAAVIRRDGLICQICGGAVPRKDVHLDHIKPVSHGGQNELVNLRVTHSKCNMRRGARVQ